MYTIAIARGPEGRPRITAVEDIEGNRTWVPLIVTLAVCIGIAVVLSISCCLYRRCTSRDDDYSESEVRPSWSPF